MARNVCAAGLFHLAVAHALAHYPVLGPTDGADPHSEINRLFSRLPSRGDYGTQKLFIFKKIKT